MFLIFFLLLKIKTEITHHGKESEETGDGADDQSPVHQSVTLRVSVSVYHDLFDCVVQGVLHRTPIPFVNLKEGLTKTMTTLKTCNRVIKNIGNNSV